MFIRSVSFALTIALILSVALPVSGVSSYTPGFYSHSASGFKRVVFYYGWLNTSNIPSLTIDILVFSGSPEIMDHQYSVISELMNNGVETYAYIHNGSTPLGLGSSFESVVNGSMSLSEWEDEVEAIISNYTGKTTGVFLDECDPSYFGYTDPDNQYVQEFTSALQDIVAYAHSQGLKAMINGVRAYASLGDYYLWEDFATIYDEDTHQYRLDHDFYSTSSSNPYDWVNGIAKYDYLSSHGLLNKTIALSFTDPGNTSLALYGYYMARILGLAGWAYSDINIYSAGGPMPDIEAYETGPAISDPLLDSGTGDAARLFAGANITVNLVKGELNTVFFEEIRKPIILDGEMDPGYKAYSLEQPGTYTVIHTVGEASTPNGLYLYMNATWSQESTGGLAHIYIDSDGNSSTGYSIGGLGADYLVETYTDNSSGLLEYTGSGSNWAWLQIGTVSTGTSGEGSTEGFEWLIPRSIYVFNTSRLIIASIVNWNDDAVTDPFEINHTYLPTPTMFRENAPLDQGYALIESISIASDKAIIDANAAHGVLARYYILLPYTGIEEVYKNNTRLTRLADLDDSEGYVVETLGNYTLLEIQVRHSSPVVITITPSSPTPPPVPEPRYIGISILVGLAIALYVLLWKRRR